MPAREKSHRYPEVLPNGKGVLFTMGSADIDTYDDARIEVLNLDTRERSILIEGGMTPRYLPTGHIVYARNGSLLAVPFDQDRLVVTGTTMKVLDGVITSPGYGSAHFALSDDGLLVFAPGGPLEDKIARLVWVNRNGEAEPMAGMKGKYGNLSLSPEGTRLAVQFSGANVSIRTHDLDRGTWTRLASGWDNMFPIWEPNGDYVTFQSSRAGAGNLFRKAVDGSGPAERLTESEQNHVPGSWSPEGSILTYTAWPQLDIWALPVQEGADPYPLVDTMAREKLPQISPDGSWLAYVSDESGRDEVYVQPFPELGPRVPVSTNGGAEPAWGPSGEIFYRERDRMIVVEFNDGRPSRPSFLFDVSVYGPGGSRRRYDVTPDGQRFLFIEDIEPEPMPDHLTLIVNWFDELESHFADE